MQERSGRRAFRRTKLTSAAVAAAVVLTFVLTSGSGAPASATFANGTASAIAQSYKVNPTEASLSIGITFGLSLADYTNAVARAESRAIDLGILGTTLAAEGCDGGDPTWSKDQQPQPIRAESSDPKAAKGYSEQEADAPFITKSVRANSTPEGVAQTTTVPLGQAGVLEIAGARSQAVAHVVHHDTREGLATADISSIDIAGVVHLSKLHWEAVDRSGADDTVKGTFTIGSANIAGTAVSAPNGDAGPVVDAANTALKPLGIQLRPPKARISVGTLHVDPLSVAVVPSPTRDDSVGTGLGTAQPVRKSITDTLLDLSCKNGSYITVADILVGSITGSGSFDVELGGVQATSGELRTTSFLGGLGGGLLGGGAPLPETTPAQSAPVGSGSGSAPAPANVADGDTARTPDLATDDSTAPAGDQQATAPQKSVVAAATTPLGSRGGALALVAGVGLAVLAAMAEGDRRLMRRAQRMTPVED